jgi:FixJ family two-component response regulator
MKTQPPQPACTVDVGVIDDDESLREAIGSLLRSVGLQVRLYPQAEAFLAPAREEAVRCLVADIRMPGLGGLDLLTMLSARHVRTPIILMSAHGDVPMSVRAMKAGALDFLAKPFRDQDMLDAVHLALEIERHMQEDAQALSELEARVDDLTRREREVMILVAAGLLNKQIAAELGLSEVTVKMHRGRVMQKIGVRSVAALARLADALGLAAPLGPFAGHAGSVPGRAAPRAPARMPATRPQTAPARAALRQGSLRS